MCPAKSQQAVKATSFISLIQTNKNTTSTTVSWSTQFITTLLLRYLFLLLLLLLAAVSENVKTETLGVEVHLVLAASVLDQFGNVPSILDLTQLNVTPGLLDRFADELRRAGFSLGSDDHGLLLLSGLVDHECGALGVLLSDLLGLDGGGELGRECQMLLFCLACILSGHRGRTVNDTSSSMMLNFAALLIKLSRTILLTASR